MRPRLARTRRAALAPDQLKAKAAKLREVAGDDPQAVAVADAFLTVDEMLAGWVERRGGGEKTAEKRWPLLPEWKGREPPENP